MNKQRLIDKDALIAFIKSNGYVYANSLETFPEVDAESVVRCKDCKYYYPDEGQEFNFVGCAKFIDGCGSYIKASENDFCSYGERKESEDT